MKLIRMLFCFIGLLILVCIVVVGSLIVFFDPNKMKPVIVEEVMNKTGYQMTIEGKLSWSFFPILGVKIDRLTLSEPKQKQPFVDLSGITVATELSQLLHGNEKLQGDVHIASAKLMNVQMTNARIELHWQDNVLTMQPIIASLYDGSLEGTVHGRNLSGVPHWDWDMKFNHIQLSPLLRDVNGGETKLSIDGLGEVALQGATSGQGHDQMLSHLNGTADFSIHNGVVKGVDLNYLLQSADALINKKPITGLTNSDQTTFESLTGAALIKNGVANTNNLLLTAPAFSAKGNGSINLLYQAINFQLQVTPAQSARTQWEIPILITGSLNRPDVRLDTTEIEKYIAKQELQKVKSSVTDQIKKHVPGKAGEFLQNLIN